MLIRTSELTAAALDWAVAKCEGIELEHFSNQYGCIVSHNCPETVPTAPGYKYSPSTNWAQGGPIIEQQKITVSALYDQKNPPIPAYALGEWGAFIPCGVKSIGAASGHTPLVAAMRCYVASKLGDTVAIPEGIL